MQAFEVDWVYLRKSLWIAGAATLLSGAFLWFSIYHLGTQTTGFQVVKAQRDQMYQQYIAAKEDAVIIRQYANRFKQLQLAGVIGDENRLDWAEVARGSANEMKLVSVRLQIEPQKAFSAAYLLNTEGYTIFASPMKLQLQLSHEVDLLDLIAHLNSRALGLFHVDSCRLERAGEGVALRLERANVSASCDLTWFTIVEGNGEAGGPA